MNFKKLLFVGLSFVLANSIVGCDGPAGGSKTEVKDVNLAAATYEVQGEEDFNRDLFYMNTLEFLVADPTVVYAEHAEDPSQEGYFYAYGTSDLIGCHGIQTWRSKDLANWEYAGVAFQPDPLNTWGVNNHWAPEIIYDNGLYFLFFNADCIDRPRYGQRALSVAYSPNPGGPFIVPTFPNVDGEPLKANAPTVDFLGHKELIESTISPKQEIRESAIDASPFIDPVSGKRYLYWSWYTEGRHVQEIFGMEMKDWFTPDYSTITQITSLGHIEVGENADPIDEGSGVNEGPFVYYKDGTYFMTLSVWPYTNERYQVRTAIADSPLGHFKKVKVEDGGVVIATSPIWSHIKSAGHHCFVQVKDQLYIAYHTFYNRTDISQHRALAVDEVQFVANKDGQLTMHTNGPTYSIQPIPEVLSGYRNVATEAKVTATNTAEGSSASYLNDGLIKVRTEDLVTEYQANPGRNQVTLEFEQPVNAKAIMVYNSMEYNYSFTDVASIEMEYIGNEDGDTAKAKIGQIIYDYEWNSTDLSVMHPGGAAVAEFDELPVKKITINFNQGWEYRISEIKVLGNTDNVTYKSEFADTYTYNNEVVLNHYVHEGTVLGGTSMFDAHYGWNFEHDGNGTDSYITNNGLQDAYVYFKDVETVDFYAEAYISTYSKNAFHMWNNVPDAYPKMGLVVRNENACMFFYIDAANSYSNQYVGYTQSKYGTSGDWDWSATEETTQVSINYSNSEFTLTENYTKLAIARIGDKFYLYVNDVLTFETDGLRSLGAEDLASVGFLGFNSPMVVKNYSITTDTAAVESKIAELG